MPKPNLQKLLKKYQKLFRLQDFDISIKYASHQDIDGVGRSLTHWHLGIARIEILDPDQNTNPGQHMQNVELTVIHELMHILLHPIVNNDATGLESNMQEQVIEKLAKAFLNV